MRQDRLPQPGGSPTARRPPVLALVAVSALSPFAINSVVPSLPSIERSLLAAPGRVQLILSLYLASVALAQIGIGPLSDRFGRRPVLLIGCALFVGASIAAPFAPSVESLIGLRILQGASGCVGIVLSRAIVRDLFDRREAASKLGYITMGLAMAPMVAPLVGGVLQERFDWGAIFWLMGAAGCLCLLVAWTSIPETNFRRAPQLSFASLFRDFRQLLGLPDFLLFAGAASLAGGVFFSFLGGAPFVAEGLMKLTPSAFGIWFALLSIGYAAGSFVTGRFAERYGLARIVLAGAVLTMAGALMIPLLFWAGMAGPAALFGPMTLAAMGNGMSLPSAISGAVSVRPEIAGAAAGLSGAAQIGTGAILSAITGSLVAGGTSAAPMLALINLAAAASLLVALRIARRNPR